VHPETSLFKIGIKNCESLIVTLLRPAHVVSWAPLHGGLRTHAREILIHRVEQDFNAAYAGITLRRAASRGRLTGTIVGMCSSGQVSDYAVGTASYEELQAETLCIADTFGLAMVGESGTFVERLSSRRSSQAINMVIAVNYNMTHEAMLEAIGIATETKVRILHEFGLRSRTSGEPATGSAVDCVAVTSGHDRRYTLSGKNTKWGELIGKAGVASLRSAIQNALRTPSRTSPLHSEPNSDDGQSAFALKASGRATRGI
jgi:adenosylcobinamide amidohydrolase